MKTGRELKCHTATKDRYCNSCNKKIPKGHRYWILYDHDYQVTLKTEHNNCELYVKSRTFEISSES